MADGSVPDDDPFRARSTDQASRPAVGSDHPLRGGPLPPADERVDVSAVPDFDKMGPQDMAKHLLKMAAQNLQNLNPMGGGFPSGIGVVLGHQHKYTTTMKRFPKEEFEKGIRIEEDEVTFLCADATHVYVRIVKTEHTSPFQMLRPPTTP